jgi:hypothetical protein
VSYFDPYVKRARIEHAREETLEFVPSWYGSSEFPRVRYAGLFIERPIRATSPGTAAWARVASR